MSRNQAPGTPTGEATKTDDSKPADDKDKQGDIYMRRVAIEAVEVEGEDGTRYAGQRMFVVDKDRLGDAQVFLDPGTVKVKHHKNGGWDWDNPNPAGDTNLWRGKARKGDQVMDETPPGTAEFQDTFGEEPQIEARDDGMSAFWPDSLVRAWGDFDSPGEVREMSSQAEPTVDESQTGIDYQSPGYQG